MFKGLLLLTFFTSFIVLSWIAFSIHHSYTTSTITPDQSIVITPISGEFDRETLERIKAKNVVVPDLEKVKPNNANQSEVENEENQISNTATPSTPSGQIEL